MSNDPEVIRAEIERTRGNLSDDVNALAEEVKPGNVARRQKERVATKVSSIKDKVMGSGADTASSVSSSVSASVSSVGDAAAAAPAQVRQQTQGNPLAAGLVAFGAGLLAASLIPASEQERQAAAAVKDKAEPLKQEVTSVAKDAAESLKEPAQQAAATVREMATDAASTVKAEGQSAAADVTSQAQEAKQSVQENQR